MSNLEKEPSPVDQALRGAAARIEELHAVLSTLEARLGPVLVPPAPEPKAAAVDGQPLMDRLADRIGFVYQRADVLGVRLGGIISRLEI